jgi:hypothetical protein
MPLQQGLGLNEILFIHYDLPRSVLLHEVEIRIFSITVAVGLFQYHLGRIAIF